MGWVEIGPLNAHLLLVTLCGADNDNCDDEEGKFVEGKCGGSEESIMY